jgi:hypothetical protein
MPFPPATESAASFRVDLRVEADGPRRPRRLEPVTCGIPWPRGTLRDVGGFALHDEQGNAVPVQARVLDRWPDQSVRWVLLDWQASVPQSPLYQLRLVEVGETPASPPTAVSTRDEQGRVTVDTGAAQFELTVDAFPFARVVAAGEGVIDPSRTRFTVEDEAGRVYSPKIRAMRLEEGGPLRAAVRLEGVFDSEAGPPLLDIVAYLHFFAGSATVRFDLTLRNPRKANHPGGIWVLGGGGSVYVRDAALVVTPAGQGPASVRCSEEPGAAMGPFPLPLELYQDSSGGENWRSPNHKNRHRAVPNTFRGYRLRAGSTERDGTRATPLVALDRGDRHVAAAMQYFWQNFPKAVTVTADALTLHLFPRQYADVHEIQGGEQKTHSFHAAFGPDTVTDEPLDWCRSPLLPRATPEWYCASGAVPYLTPRADDPNAEYLRLVDAAIEGADTFERKREVLDEYGWRHFGDIYGDHEAVFHKGPLLVSHYNNQYDPVAGFAYQFLRSCDPRWWHAMRELAAHVIDVDIYHTDRDKAAYNHGLFWHTYHYVDADTATHRTYPRTDRVDGGGPANENVYATGLMLHHFLTGDPLSRESAVGLAHFVIDIDDGDKTVFRWLARGPTGLASSSRTSLYHGPGRGSANSVAALLDGHRLTGDPAFLIKAEELIRRVIHPADDVEGRNLLDAENRWFYTMFLQSLGRYLDYKAELGQLDRMYAYARAGLLHYARWMAEREYPYLEKPDILEYPTETWAAQDMRKSEVFKYAARHAAGQERARFMERSEFFFRYATTALAGMKTRTLCRPVVLLLSYGLMHAYFQRHPDAAAPPPAEAAHNFGVPEVFVPQKVRAKKRLKLLAAASAGLFAVAVLVGMVYWLTS